MWKNILKIGLLVLILILSSSSQIAYAKKAIPRGKSTTGSIGVAISPRLRSDRLALIINFSGLSQTNSLSYTLSYKSNGIPQGVSGAIRPTANTTQRELLFGTCSSGVCRYHTGLSEMKLVVVSKLKSGKKTTKTFRIKP